MLENILVYIYNNLMKEIKDKQIKKEVNISVQLESIYIQTDREAFLKALKGILNRCKLNEVVFRYCTFCKLDPIYNNSFLIELTKMLGYMDPFA